MIVKIHNGKWGHWGGLIEIEYDDYLFGKVKYGQFCRIDDYDRVRKKQSRWRMKEALKRSRKEKEKKKKEILKQKEEQKINARKERQKQYEKYHEIGTLRCSAYPTDIPYKERKAFYKTEQWIIMRNNFMNDKNTVMKCACCGAIPDSDYKKVEIDMNRPQSEKDMLYHEFQANRLVVDHKLPIKHFWHLRLEPSNLQMLCGLCNKEKLNTYSVSDIEKIHSITNTPQQLLKVVKKNATINHNCEFK
tara:strand:- start:368 stop:1108 length:741 start_codon:yes stop_codon:yes gene_type:complete